MLVAIGCYERYMAPGHSSSKGMELITSGKGAAMSLFKSLPRLSLVEYVPIFSLLPSPWFDVAPHFLMTFFPPPSFVRMLRSLRRSTTPPLINDPRSQYETVTFLISMICAVNCVVPGISSHWLLYSSCDASTSTLCTHWMLFHPEVRLWGQTQRIY